MPHRKYPPWATVSLFVLLAAALLRDLVANDCPLFCRVGGEVFFPAFRTLLTPADRLRWQAPLDSFETWNRWQTADYQSVVFAPVAFRPGRTSADAERLPPLSRQNFSQRKATHWLGTDASGRDVAAGMVAGARATVVTGTVAMGVAGLLGILIGGLAGYFGDDRLRLSRGRLAANLLALPLAIFFAFAPRWFYLSEVGGWAEWGRSGLVFSAIFLIFNALAWLLERRPFFSKKIYVPADFLLMRLAEIFDAIPPLLLVVSVAAISTTGKTPVLTMVALIGLFTWPGVARFLRAQLLRVRELEYVQSARALGFSDLRIFGRHALPNAVRPLFIAFALGVAGAVTLEASLTFLGFTSSPTGASWGGILHEAQNNMSLWWLAVFPGLAIAWTVMALHALADAGRERG